MANKKEPSFNVLSFVEGSEENKNLSLQQHELVPVEATIPAPKRSSKKKKDDVEVIPTPIPQTSMSYIQDNIPYQMAYNETNQQLDTAIKQLDMLGGEMMQDLQLVRASKTMKNKYGYINNMTENAVGIINAKISAIKEKNATISKVNELEIRRIKELKLQQSQQDDNARISELYNAFVSMPMGNGPAQFGPSFRDMTLVGGAPDLARMAIGDDQAQWEQSLDAAGRRMLLEAQGAIETVVVYDESSGNRWYDVVDKQTRQPVPGVEKPDPESVYNLDISIAAGIAKDSNRNVIYPLIVINGNSSINQY